MSTLPTTFTEFLNLQLAELPALQEQSREELRIKTEELVEAESDLDMARLKFLTRQVKELKEWLEWSEDITKVEASHQATWDLLQKADPQPSLPAAPPAPAEATVAPPSLPLIEEKEKDGKKRFMVKSRTPEEQETWETKYRPDYENLPSYFPFSEVRAGQSEVLEYLRQALMSPTIKYIIMEAPTGCHAAGTKVWMFNGTTKCVEDVKIGDLLMGPDSKPRRVDKLYNGHQNMYKITLAKGGGEFVVNEDHILSLYRTRGRKLKGKKDPKRSYREYETSLENISVKEYLKLSKYQKHLLYSYKSGPISFGNRKLALDPYILGLWLGDGNYSKRKASSCLNLTTMDPELEEAWSSWAIRNGDRIRVGNKKRKDGSLSKAKKYSVSGGRGNQKPLKSRKLFDYYKLFSGNKHIPEVYFNTSIEDRLQLLAGLVDTDGHLNKIGKNIQIYTKTDRLAQDIVRLARSIGFRAIRKHRNKTCTTTGYTGVYNEIIIYGPLHLLPTRLPRKQTRDKKRFKNHLVYKFEIESVGVGEYFGFNLRGDHLYLLEDFTVTHNSGKSPFAITAAKASKLAYVATANKLLQEQYQRDFSKDMADLKGRTNYACAKYGDKKDLRGEPFNCGTAPCRVKKNDCTGQCDYHVAKEEAQAHPTVSMNFSALLAHMNFVPGWDERNLLILDEAHLLPEVLTDFGTLTLTRGPLQKHELAVDLPDFNTLGAYKSFIEGVKGACSKKVAYLKENGTEAEIKTLSELESLQNKFVAFEAALMGPLGLDNIVLEKTYNEKQKHILESVAFKPIQVGAIFKKTIEPNTRKFLFMSATILDFQTFTELLGLPPSEIAAIRVPSTFPKENRPIYTSPSVGPLNMGNLDSNMPALVGLVDQILEKYPDKKGIIHANSYKVCQQIVNRSRHRARLLYPERASEQKEILRLHLNGSRPTVLISPSMAEGVDLQGDSSRFQIIAKIPYPYLGDPVVVRRKDLYPRYYAMRTALTVVQAYGRSVRSPTDTADTYILDKSFWNLMRTPEVFPPWFLEAIIR